VELTFDPEDDHGIRAKLLPESLDGLIIEFPLSAHLDQASTIQS